MTAENGSTKYVYKQSVVKQNGGAGGFWFMGFIGALVYYLHAHGGSFWLVILAILKALVWPAFLVYNLMVFLKV